VTPDWQLPPGTDRGLWDYVSSERVAREYDAALAGTPLLEIDLRFAERFFTTPGRLVDLGCGTGRLLFHCAARGFACLGVDLSEAMLDVVRQKAEQEGLKVERLKANLVELDALPDASFDYAACLFSTLGMVLGAANRRRMIGHVYRLLRPGGLFVLHVHNRWFNVWNRPGRTWLLRDRWERLLGRVEGGDRVMPVHQGVAGLTLHLFTRGEAIQLLTEAGFRIREVRPVSLRADGRLIWPWWFGPLRAYGYLLAAEKPA
jgi:ubiquinone/menaquinone biosynthesis C-methylase UbiE